MLSAAIEVERAPVVGAHELCSVVDEILRNMPLLRSVVVADDDMKPVGLVSRSTFLLQLSQRFGRALYENRPIRQLMDTEPLVVNRSVEFDEFVRTSFLSGRHELQDCFILTDEDGHYYGVSNGKSVMTALLDVQRSLVTDLSMSQTQLVEANERLGREVCERRLAEQAAINASNRDPLTGLFNRAPFVESVSERIAAGDSFSIIFLDLDGFKTLNDVYGHLAGDEALRVVAARMAGVCEDAVCARFGGDEFALVFSDACSDDEAMRVAAKLHDLVTEPFDFDGATLKTGASLGVAGFPQDAERSNEILQAADMAMLRAKREGGGVRMFNRDIDASDVSARTQLHALTSAIQAQEIVPHFQPVFSLRADEPVMYEVLARWPTADAPLGQPACFIPVAEREGLIDDLFWLIFSQACHKVRHETRTIRLAFNVSARQLQNPKFPSRFLDGIARHGFAPSQFEVEVTETAMIANEKLADAALRVLAAEGVSIALDDFGTGYSSLSLLHKFSFSKLKIDHSFVSRMLEDNRSRDIVATTILMAERLGLQTVAEGVEDEATLELLRRAGCHMVQGYHLARPAPDFLPEAGMVREVAAVA